MTAATDGGASPADPRDDDWSPSTGDDGTVPSADRWTSRFWWILLGVVVLAVVVRVLAVTSLTHLSPYQTPQGDGLYYLISSATLEETGEFGTRAADGTAVPDALHPPLWVAYLAGARMVGAATAQDLRFASVALGILTVVLVGLAGRRLLSARTGIVAAGLAAVSPAFWTYERNLNAEAITFPLIAGVILLAYRYRDRPSLLRFVAVAALFGVLALARSEQAIVGAIVLAGLALDTRSIDLAHRIGRLALGGAVAVLLVAPWTVHNLSRFEHPVILSNGAGNAMLAGACDRTFSGDRMGGFDPGCVLEQPDVLWGTDRTVVDRRQREVASEYVRAHVGELPAVVVAREGRAWAFYDIGHQNQIHAEALDLEVSWVWLQTVLFWILLPMAVVGVVLLRRAGVAVYPLLAFPVVAVVTVAITFGDIRYRAASEVTLVLLAAAGLDLLLRQRRTRSTSDRLTPGSG